MACLIRRVGLLQIGMQPMLQQTRSRGDVNLYKRKPKVKVVHLRKAQLLSVLKPQYEEQLQPMWETCGHVVNIRQQEIPLTQYETIVMRDMMNRFKHAKLVTVFASNPISVVDLRRAEVYFGRKQMTLKKFPQRILRQGLRDSVYANLIPLFEGPTYLLFCAEPTVKEMFQIVKKYPQFIVLGGYMEDRLVSHTHLTEFANLPSLEASRVRLLSTLNSAALQLVRNIETSQTVLVSHLESRADELRKSEGSQGSTDAAKVSENEAEIKEAKS